ncbi:MAG: hypothetical protein HYT76_03040 [Deltaproteobacteria bacterium]|nr:hypothetical protein [Deltaproteobacteria bacterium]
MRNPFGFLIKKRVEKKPVRSPLPQDRFLEMISAFETAELKARATDFSGGLALEVAPHLKPLASLLKGPRFLVSIGTTEGATLQSREDLLPFLNTSLELVLLRSYQGRKHLSALLRETSRVLKRQGQLILVDLHPFSPMVQEEFQNQPATEEGIPPGFERYFRFLGSGGWIVEGVKESFFDNNSKKFFKDDLPEKFEEFRRKPCLILLVLRKGGG